ncbi:DUF4373 domain-containing protein [Chitinophaga nivalis]|uniref:DUF4373 domain-containing protein n=1 Tax=Chitinophaga nivalis TaxID=2991709 RepID=A0ABT3IIL8_9BACT|nr:DUF4373 domain-containing protein [Chitinophaga nivalis]MCW3466532.1 DUF4373 domain-containing protein [Chitinophaga nivalis]MCW3483777.1 DUF4373 domain-containing protein [Chitinophaga nivalis]
MANIKTGFHYYSIETDRYQDIKIKRLKKECGCNGLAVYDYILCEIYRVKGCFISWDESTAFDVAEYLGLKESQVNEIVNYCCHVGLFNKELLASERVLTSSSIQLRFVDWSKKAKRANYIIPEDLLILPEYSSKLPEECGKLKEESQQSKVKESKEKKKKEEEDASAIIEKLLRKVKAQELIIQRLGTPDSKPPPGPAPPPSFEELASTAAADENFYRPILTSYGITMEVLTGWLTAFNRQLKFDGKTGKSQGDYRRHFVEWLKFRDMSNPPENYSPVKNQNGADWKSSNTGNQSPSSGTSGGAKGAFNGKNGGFALIAGQLKDELKSFSTGGTAGDPTEI